MLLHGRMNAVAYDATYRTVQTIEVHIHLSSDSHFYAGLAGDVSEGGIFYATYRAFPIGSEVELVCHIPGSAEPLRAFGKVAWLREHSVHGPRGVGITLGHLAEGARALIQAFCRARPPLYYEGVLA